MPKKRNNFQSFKPSIAANSNAASGAQSNEKSQRSVNELLANLRRTAAGPASSHHAQSSNTPSVPPAIREILQLPETPAPRPRRPIRTPRFDDQGRRLPAGPPPPRSWLSSRHDSSSLSEGGASSALRLNKLDLLETGLPGVHLPARGSLIDVVLRAIARDWSIHRTFNHYYLFYVPSHLKPALIRYVGAASHEGVSITDLRAILESPDDNGPTSEEDVQHNEQVTYLDLSGSIGHSLKIKELSVLLFPSGDKSAAEEPEESWERSLTPPRPVGALVPHLTHLSLAIRPGQAEGVSWKQLLALSSKLGALTHLSLANWPEPCLTPRARYASVSTPQGHAIPYSGTSYYSHSLDQDWTEALLVLRMLSKHLYALEYLDLTGCTTWFKALRLSSEHDYVDWATSWGKVTSLKLYMGWKPDESSLPSARIAFNEAAEEARLVEKHIIAMRAGKGRFINVERNRLET